MIVSLSFLRHDVEEHDNVEACHEHDNLQACSSTGMCLYRHAPLQACASTGMCLYRHPPLQSTGMCLTNYTETIYTNNQRNAWRLMTISSQTPNASTYTAKCLYTQVPIQPSAYTAKCLYLAAPETRCNVTPATWLPATIAASTRACSWWRSRAKPL